MVIKPYQEPPLLELLRCLNQRFELPNDERQQYINLEKGHQGEQKFSELLENLTNDCLILHGLLLKCNNTLFQIDTLLIFENMIYLVDVKYYEGDYYVNSGNWYTLSKKEIHNPVLQLNRCVSLFRRLLQKYGVNLPVEGYVLFNHPEFTLYHADPELPIILPNQINRFMKQLHGIPSKTNDQHMRLAQKLLSDHKDESPYTHLPEYSYEQVKKGIVCASCHSLSTSLIGSRVICNGCGKEEKVDNAILRSIKEFMLLFPDRKITTNTIQEWCRVIKSRNTIRRILGKHFTIKGHGNYAYYVNFDQRDDE